MAQVVPREKRHGDKALDKDKDHDGVVFDQVPVRVDCPHCGMNVITFIEHESSWITYAVCCTLLLVLNWAALIVVPVVYPLVKDVVHHCPRCLSVLATRSRVALPSFRQEVMSFRFGSCVVVLARKYVFALLAMMAVVGGFHFLRTSGMPAHPGEALPQRESPVAFSWEDFLGDCGAKSYLRNPIHVSVAFDEKYRNRSVSWQGTAHHVEAGFSIFGWEQRGAVFVQMPRTQPPREQGRSRGGRDNVDLALLFSEREKVAAEALQLAKGDRFGFEAGMVQVGKRGQPHVAILWEIRRAKDGNTPGVEAGAPRGGPGGAPQAEGGVP